MLTCVYHVMFMCICCVTSHVSIYAMLACHYYDTSTCFFDVMLAFFYHVFLTCLYHATLTLFYYVMLTCLHHEMCLCTTNSHVVVYLHIWSQRVIFNVGNFFVSVRLIHYSFLTLCRVGMYLHPQYKSMACRIIADQGGRTFPALLVDPSRLLVDS